MLKTMVIPKERIPGESEDGGDTDDTTSAVEEPETSHGRRSLVDMILSDHTRSRSVPSSPVRTHYKAKREKDREYKGFGVVYLPGDIKGLTNKLQFLAADFFADNTTVRNELVHVLDALLRLKQLTRKEYTDITARLAASL